MDEFELYESGLSITEVSKKTGIPKSTIRFRLHKINMLRTRSEGIKNASKKGLLGSGLRGKKRVLTQEWKDKISASKTGKGNGVSLKQNGYIVITMGKNKGRCVHVVIMEKEIGRRLYSNECIHHINEDKSDNRICNLKIMTRSEHASLHAKANLKYRARDSKGRFL